MGVEDPLSNFCTFHGNPCYSKFSRPFISETVRLSAPIFGGAGNLEIDEFGQKGMVKSGIVLVT